MKVYLVGGAVRDEFLQRPVKDRDYVVVGSTSDEMLSLGYAQVGADFPVFLHPISREEYALARTERKVGVGYHGFVTDFNSDVTLEQDLLRRDLTCNSLAVAVENWDKFVETKDRSFVIDPFNGIQDLDNGILRHTSDAFSDDPLRTIRVARFRARYNFRIAPETIQLMQKLVQSGELKDLTPERVWLELEKGLSETNPVAFIMTLMTVDAWGVLFPEIRVGGTLLKLRNRHDLSFDAKLMIIFSDTPTDCVLRVLEKYKASADTIRAIKVFKQLQLSAKDYLDPIEILEILKKIDAFRRPRDLEVVSSTILAPDMFSMFVANIHHAFMKIRDVSFSNLAPEQQMLKGSAIGEAIDELRLKVM
jgi:tRNA nucleotidyltransferase (CCA-adding enzyme)